MDSTTSTSPAYIDCACVIHSDGYDWQYVDTLYNMLTQNLSQPIRFHVYTEADRPVPPHMIKHVLSEWSGISGPKKSWWYKMQLFNNQLFAGQLLYFDLDVVITGNLDWITKLPKRNFWAIHDFRRLWKKTCRTINSSVMYFDTNDYNYVWTKFQQLPLTTVVAKYKGDQDFITEAIEPRHLRYFDLDRIISWRWQAINQGFYNRKPPNPKLKIKPNIPSSTSILVFHGSPKPHEIDDDVIVKHWTVEQNPAT
jgi:hypothetical protein